MDVYSNIASTIKKKRKKLGLSQEDLGTLIGVAPSTISMYEKGERKPELMILKDLSEALSVSLAELINIEVPRNSIDIALRSQRLDHEDVEKVKDYIAQLKYERKLQYQKHNQPNRLKARRKAKSIIEKLNIKNAPIKLSSVLKFLEIEPIKGDEKILKKVSAFIDLEGKILVYKNSDPTVRKRFSIAHEIGHFVMGHTVKDDVFDIDSTDPREIEANMFAAELLMPFDWVKRDMQDHNLTIKDLAMKYWVSEEAMGWRLFKSDALLLA
jgi:Zn-dependent peptidase ImmA (M78 family)/DNA-binding XRE family transcriptional regulator